MSQAVDSAPSLLELLPPEILLAILTQLSHPERRALVHASPTLHAVYAANRRFLLQQHLEAYFGSVMADVYAVYQLQMLHTAARDSSAVQSRVGAMRAIMQRYADSLAARDQQYADGDDGGDRDGGAGHLRRCMPAWPPRLSVAQSTYILAFFRRSVLPVRSKCVAWAVARMPRRVRKPLGMESGRGMTSSEAMRTTRAVYRFQMLSLLAGSEPHAATYRELVAFMLDAIEPWEVAELITVYSFASVVYRDLLSGLKRTSRPGVAGASILGFEEEQEIRERLVLCGLDPLRAVLFDTEEKSQMLSLLIGPFQCSSSQSARTSPSTEGRSGVPSLFHDRFPEDLRTMDRPTQALQREEMSVRRCAFPFRGDGEPGAAPLAWTALWRDTYSNVPAWTVPYGLKIWGWAFWDARTLETSGLLQPMRDEWQRRWGNADPRDASVW
ncbi:hypothetical protein BROUX41_000310 [Berkeleyomyces rouxiae]|uniref:uncharacterized protein n=1 Tax=Berkeleyomyces rouxiae TaxID=2035830 RepID=UPI003B7FBD05